MTTGASAGDQRSAHPAVSLIKWIVILVGLVGTILCLMALIGRLTDLFWVRVAGAAVTAIFVPALIADRLLPETDPKPKGLVSKVFAVTWLAFTLLFVLAARDYTKPLLAAEGDRLVADGWDEVGALSHLLAGGPPPAPTPDPSLAAASATAAVKPSSAPTAAASTPVAAADPTATGGPSGAQPAPSSTPSAAPSAQPSAVATAELPPLPPRGSKREGCTYPNGPYGISKGEVLPRTLQWQGFAPGSEEPTTVEASDLFDCDGKGGINAVVIDTSQYG